MDHPRPTAGFIDILILIAGITGLAAVGILKDAPKLISSQFSETKQQPVATVSAELKQDENTIQADEVTGVALTDALQLEVNTLGERKLITLLGAEPLATAAADCIRDQDLKDLREHITGKTVYLVQYDAAEKLDGLIRYVFLEDSTLLNEQLIASGIAVASDIEHPYEKEFQRYQQTAHHEKRGIWSDRCNPTPTPSPRARASKNLPVVTPAELSQKPSATRTPAPSATPGVLKKIVSAVQGIVTLQSPTPTPTVTLESYISSPSAKIAPPSNNADLILQLINFHRQKKNLPPFETEPELCRLAQSRAPELHNEIFGDGRVHEGLTRRNIPYWITENMASYPTEETVVNWWLGSTIHRNAIENNYRYSCGACSGNSCVQLFTSYVRK